MNNNNMSNKINYSSIVNGRSSNHPNLKSKTRLIIGNGLICIANSKVIQNLDEDGVRVSVIVVSRLISMHAS